LGPPGKTAAKAAKEKIVKKKNRDKSSSATCAICGKPQRTCTRHQNKIDKLIKMINSDEFYDWDDKDINRLIKIIKHAMSQPCMPTSRSREEYLEQVL